VGSLLPYAYPLFRIPVEVSRVTTVHNACMARAIGEELPEARVCLVPMPIEIPTLPEGSVKALRRRLGFDEHDVVVGAFGLLTPEKRIDTLARALARARPHLPRLRLLLVGPIPDRPGLEAILGRHDVGSLAVVSGRVPLDELSTHIAAADIVAQLRYPTARETSAALLRVLALGRASIVSDLENLAELPEQAVVRADLADEEGAVTRALLRLGADAPLRMRLGREARAFVASRHTPEHCIESWDEALAIAAAAPTPRTRAWPAHWLAGVG
jgi:glycosyltransferase involved in cell wall biosynthesis